MMMTDHVLQDEERLKEGLRKLLDEAEKAIREKMPEVLFAYDGFFPLYTEQGKRRHCCDDFIFFRGQCGTY